MRDRRRAAVVAAAMVAGALYWLMVGACNTLAPYTAEAGELPEPGGVTEESTVVETDDKTLDDTADLLRLESDPDPNVSGVTNDAGRGRIRVYWQFHGRFNFNNPPKLMAERSDLDGVIVGVPWGQVHPARGVFDFMALDAEIDWWAARGKQVMLRTGAYGLRSVQKLTPEWIYTEGVPAVEFQADPRSQLTARIPRVWDSRLFMTLYEEYLTGLAARYDGDPRISHVLIGTGHLGVTTASATRGGQTALPAAGWTPDKWEAYILGMIDMYARKFTRTKLVIATSPVWLRNYKELDIAPALRRIALYTTQRGASLMMVGLDPDPGKYARRPFSTMLDSLANVDLPAGFSVFLGDDWPLWVGENRRRRNRGESDRDERGLQSALQIALQEWDRLDRRGDLVLMLLRPTIEATTPGHENYRQEVADILAAFLASE
jgi:hypothetical protein